MSGRWANVDKQDDDRLNEMDVLGASSVSVETTTDLNGP